MNKVIEQPGIVNLNIQVSTNDDLDITLSQSNNFTHDEIRIIRSKAREVALAICPELGEPTIKTDNTKVILHLESELKEAIELLEKIAYGEFSYDDLVTFLTKHKSK